MERRNHWKSVYHFMVVLTILSSIFFSFLNQILNVDKLSWLASLFKTAQDYETSDLYDGLNRYFRYITICGVLILGFATQIFALLSRRVNVHKDFVDYKTITTDFTRFVYIQFTGWISLIIFTLIFINLNFKVDYIMYLYIGLIYTGITFIISTISNNATQKVVKRMGKIKASKFTIPDDYLYEDPLISPLLPMTTLLTFVIFLISLMVSVNQFAINSSYINQLPNEIPITEKSHIGYHQVCNSYSFIACYENEFLDQYYVDDIDITIDEESMTNLLSIKDYSIDLIYNGEQHSLTRNDFNFVQVEETYHYRIDINAIIIDKQKFDYFRITFIDNETSENLFSNVHDADFHFYCTLVK